MAIRLALCGASGTGKTTLAKWLGAELGVPINPVGSRSVAKAMGFDNPYDVDAAGRRSEFQRRLVTEKRGWENAHENLVVDRTTLDNLAYTMIHDMYSVDAELLREIVQGMKRYTHIVYCPVEAFCRTSTDENRVGGGKYGKAGDNTYHVLYDVMIQGLLNKYTPEGMPRLILNSDQLEVRKEEVLRFVTFYGGV